MRFFSSKKLTPEIISKYEKQGFNKHLITQAWEACQGNDSKMPKILESLHQQNMKMLQEATTSPYRQVSPGVYKFRGEENDFNKALENSLKDQVDKIYVYEPLNPEQRIRPSGLPVGLKNIGNTCYVNSLFQTYFMSEKFVAAILQYNPEVILLDDYMTASESNKTDRDVKKVRIEASIKLAKSLQRLFAMMIKSHKRYVDPTEVLNSVVDDLGQKIPIGDQKDVTEYHLNFLSRIEEAFYYQDKFLKATGGNNSPSSIPIQDLPTSFLSLSMGFSTGRSQYQTEVSLPPSQPQENSIIKKHFFGRMNQFMTYHQDGEEMVEKKELIFGPIIIDVAAKNLYAAIEHYCSFVIDDYRTPNGGEVTRAEGKLWISKPPELLFVQLNRVVFDKNKGTPIKINDPFSFEKEIYLDRFMMDYKDEALKINQHIVDLKGELEQKENSLQKILSNFESKLDIIKILDITGDFLKKQISFDISQPVVMHSDSMMVGQLDDVEKINTAVDIVFKYKESLENKIEDLKKTISAIKNTIDTLWGKLNKHKYHLVSVLVHDGHAGSGHYYSFNREPYNDTWKKFNDFNVSEEKEEIVMTESLGGYENASAYSLVYISDEAAKEEIHAKSEKTPTKEGEEENEVTIEKQHYARYLSPALRQEMFFDNLNFRDEVEEFRFNAFSKSVVDLYKFRYDMVTKALQSKTAKYAPTYLNSFGNFLRYDPHFEYLLKWYILDTSLQDFQKNTNNDEKSEEFSLRKLKNHPTLLQKLYNLLINLPKPFLMEKLVLTSQEENQLECKIAEYMTEVPIMIYTKFLIPAFINDNWQDACYAVKMLFELEKNSQSYIYKLVKDIAKVNCLKLALIAEENIKNGHTEKACETLRYLTALAKGLLRPDEGHIPQIKAILMDALQDAEYQIPDVDFNQLKEHVNNYIKTPHTLDELNKVIENYSPEELSVELQNLFNENLYGWKDINEESYSNQIKRLVDLFRQTSQLYVAFHNDVYSNKSTMKKEERRKVGYMFC